MPRWILLPALFAGLLTAPVWADAQTKVSIDAADRSVRDVLSTLARAAGVELVVRPEVRGQITVRIREMPFEQALEVVTSTAGLRWRKIDGVYHVGRFSAAADGGSARRETIPLRRHDARALAATFGYLDRASLDEPAPSADLRHLLPPGLAGPPAPSADGQALEVRGTPAAIADLRHLIGMLEEDSALITYELFAATLTPEAVAALPVAWLGGALRIGASPGRQLRSGISDYRDLLRRLRAGRAGVMPLADTRAVATELAPVEVAAAPVGAEPVLFRLVSRLEQALHMRLFLTATVPQAAGPVSIEVDGALLPPEEGCLLVSEPNPGEPGAAVLVLMVPRVEVTP